MGQVRLTPDRVMNGWIETLEGYRTYIRVKDINRFQVNIFRKYVVIEAITDCCVPHKVAKYDIDTYLVWDEQEHLDSDGNPITAEDVAMGVAKEDLKEFILSLRGAK